MDGRCWHYDHFGHDHSFYSGVAIAAFYLSDLQRSPPDRKTIRCHVATHGDLHAACERGRDARTGAETLINHL